jgi:NAD(P)-dependent dehydrogenase (short-subunit alcohol dehydrogenase family)
LSTLEGKRAVVIGGSSGFGEQIAERFVREGARVVVAARGKQRLLPVAARIGAKALCCDITRHDEVVALARDAAEALGGLDVAVNSAGYEDMGFVRDLTPERVEKMVAVQFTGALYVIQQMAAAMTGGGSIVTISSLTATLVAEGYAHYAGAKAGINHTTRIAASEYGASGVRVNLVSPTIIETAMTEQLLNAPGVKQAFLQETPLGRIGRIDDVVSAVAWLAGDESSFVTGQNLHVDGGTSLRRLPRMDDFIRAAQRKG